MKRRANNTNGTFPNIASNFEKVQRQKHQPKTGRQRLYAVLWSTLTILFVSTPLLVHLGTTALSNKVPQKSSNVTMLEQTHDVREEIFLKDLSISSTHPVESLEHPGSKSISTTSRTTTTCAICFFGLPRSFQLLVLPSIIQNVLKPNQKSTNRCDIYLHYYQMETETKSRSSAGGTLDTEQVWLLSDAINQLYNRNVDGSDTQNKVHLSIVSDTDNSFQKQRGKQLEMYMVTKGPDGKPLYFPWMAKSYDNRSIENIVKQWHSISQVWTAMEQGAVRLERNYTRVAMLRNDVMYMTPLDIYQVSNVSRDDANRQVVVPNWARFPINDRLVYGPYQAVKIWATERFDRLETHVRTYNEPGYGLHSERFLDHSIFPPIRELGFSVVANPEICFFRVRADGTTWINDCATRNGAAIGFRDLDMAQRLVEELVGHSCIRGKFKQRIVQLDCKEDVKNSTSKV